MFACVRVCVCVCACVRVCVYVRVCIASAFIFACYISADIGVCEHVDAVVFTSSIYQLTRRRIDGRSTPPGPNTADSWHTSDGLTVLDMKTFAASSPSRNLQYHQCVT